MKRTNTLHKKVVVDGENCEIWFHVDTSKHWFSILHDGKKIAGYLFEEPNEDDIRGAMDDFYGVDEWGHGL